MRKFIALLALAVTAAAPALAVRFAGLHANPLLALVLFGVAILAAGFMLSWGAETAEKYVAQGLIVAVLALVTVLPEYAVDIYYALQAGRDPQSKYVHYAAANMTGANRLLIGAAWPLMLLLVWLRARKQAIELPTKNSIEIGFLLLPTLYAFVMVAKDRIDLLDTAVLMAMFGAYMWRVSRLPREQQEDEDPGPAAAIAHLRPSSMDLHRRSHGGCGGDHSRIGGAVCGIVRRHRPALRFQRIPADPVARAACERSAGDHPCRTFRLGRQGLDRAGDDAERQD